MTDLFIIYVVGVVMVSGLCVWIGSQDEFGEMSFGSVIFMGLFWPAVLFAILVEFVVSSARALK